MTSRRQQPLHYLAYLRVPVPTMVSSISPDAKSLLFYRGDVGQADVWLLDLTQPTGPSAARALLSGPADEGLAQFAPNGRWLMYVSADSGRNEVYLAPVESAGGKRQLSTGGGVSPRWRRDGREVYYVKPGGDLVAVEISWEPSGPRVGRSRTLFSGVSAGGVYIQDSNMGAYGYDVAPDGQRFIVIQDQATSSPPLTVVKNWTATLKRSL